MADLIAQAISVGRIIGPEAALYIVGAGDPVGLGGRADRLPWVILELEYIAPVTAVLLRPGSSALANPDAANGLAVAVEPALFPIDTVGKGF